MAIHEQINMGTGPGSGDGETARGAYTIVNDNFTLLEVLAINAQVGTTYVPLLTDANVLITMNNASSNTVTIPANSTVAYPVGTSLYFMQLGAGTTTIAITDDTLSGPIVAPFTTREAYVPVTALKIGTTSWVITGNLTGVL